MSTTRRGRGRGSGRTGGWSVLVFVGPATLGFALFVLLPLVLTIVFSFAEYGLFTAPEPNGVENYRQMAADPRLAKVLSLIHI